MVALKKSLSLIVGNLAAVVFFQTALVAAPKEMTATTAQGEMAQNPYVARKKTELRSVGVKAFTDPNYKPGIVRHIVLFRYDASITSEQKTAVRRKFLSLKKRCIRNGKPYIQSIEAGSQISGEGVGGGFEDGFLVTFKSQGDANYYIGTPIIKDPKFFDPAHEAFKKFVGPLLRQPANPSGVLVFDMADDAFRKSGKIAGPPQDSREFRSGR